MQPMSGRSTAEEAHEDSMVAGCVLNQYLSSLHFRRHRFGTATTISLTLEQSKACTVPASVQLSHKRGIAQANMKHSDLVKG